MLGKYLFQGGYVATLDDDLGDFNDGAVLVEDGVIKAVGKAGDISSTDAEIIDTTDGIVIPGMVDTHRHVSMSLTRGIGLDQALWHFLSNTYTRWLPATSVEDMRLSAMVGALEAIDSGITTIIDTCESFHTPAHAEAELQGLRDSGVRAFYMFGMGHDQYGEMNSGEDAWNARFAHLKQLRSSNNAKDTLVQVGLQISIPGGVPFNYSAAELAWARDDGVLSCSHSCGTVNSIVTKDTMERHDHDLLLSGHIYIHGTSLTPQELDLIATSGGKVAITLHTDMQMGMGIPPIRACIERGIEPSLSIDTFASVASDLFSQMKLALQTQRMLDHHAAQQKVLVPHAIHYTARDALIWGTRNGAKAVDMGDRIGTLTPGKRADIVFISNKRFLSASAFPLGTAVMHSSPADVDTVMIDGIIRKRDGGLVGQNVQDIRAKAKAALQRILENLSNFRAEMTPEEVKSWFTVLEKMTRVNLARGYEEDSFDADGYRVE